MMNLLIRLISLIVCLGLLVGGAILTYTETMKNDKFFDSFEEINNAEWIPGINETEDETEDETGDQTGDETGDETGDGTGDQTGDETNT